MFDRCAFRDEIFVEGEWLSGKIVMHRSSPYQERASADDVAEYASM